MKCFVTGAAGFIGSSLTDRLLTEGYEVVGYDNLSSGQMEFLREAHSYSTFSFVKGDILDAIQLREAMRGADIVFHLAANADVRFGPEHTFRDLEQNTIGTHRILEAMRFCGVTRIAFASTGSVYGDASVIPTPEDCPFPVQTSLYGCSKLASEGLISAYSEAFGIQAMIFRFVSILGERYTHGHVFDFCKKLRRDPACLDILGDGKQRKSYLYVQDCITAILTAISNAADRISIFNLGQSDYCDIDFSVSVICRELGLRPRLNYGGGERGWVGDSPFIYLDCARMRSLGWSPSLSIEASIIRTVRYLVTNEWVFERRT